MNEFDVWMIYFKSKRLGLFLRNLWETIACFKTFALKVAFRKNFNTVAKLTLIDNYLFILCLLVALIHIQRFFRFIQFIFLLLFLLFWILLLFYFCRWILDVCFFIEKCLLLLIILRLGNLLFCLFLVDLFIYDRCFSYSS